MSTLPSDTGVQVTKAATHPVGEALFGRLRLLGEGSFVESLIQNYCQLDMSFGAWKKLRSIKFQEAMLASQSYLESKRYLVQTSGSKSRKGMAKQEHLYDFYWAEAASYAPARTLINLVEFFKQSYHV